MKFKVGDLVRYVRSNDMYAIKSKLIIGHEYKVVEIYPQDRLYNLVRVSMGGWWITGDCFDLVKPLTMVIDEQGGFTTI